MYLGMIFLCIAGPLSVDTMCTIYGSDRLYETEQLCLASVQSVLKTEEFDAIVKMPEFDTQYNGSKCIKLEE